MKNLFILVLFFTSLEILCGQGKSLVGAMEGSIGFGNVDIFNEAEFVVDNDVCVDFCDRSIMRNSGSEINIKLLGSLRWKQQHEFVAGTGFNLWNYRVDRVDNISGEGVIDVQERVGIFNLMLGYRYLLKQHKKNTFFLEALSNVQLVPVPKFVVIMFAIEPGLGCKINLTDRLSFNSVISYKIGLNDISYDVEEVHMANVLGIRLGLSRTF